MYQDNEQQNNSNGMCVHVFTCVLSERVCMNFGTCCILQNENFIGNGKMCTCHRVYSFEWP